MEKINLVEIYGKIWINGELADADSPKAYTHLSAFAIHYGKSVFEGIRFYDTRKGPAIFRLKDHTKRFFESAKIINLKIPYSQDDINRAIIETVAACGLKSGYIRPIAFAGPGALGLISKNNLVVVAVLVWSWGAYLGKEGMEKGIRLKTSSYIKSSASMFCKSKCAANYVLASLAKEEACQCGYDDAIHLDEKGLVSECSAANIFIVKNSQIITPPLSAPILAGITRDSVINILTNTYPFMDLYKVIERDICREELYAADECFICGTAAEITPVKEIDGMIIGDGIIVENSLSRKIQKVYLETAKGLGGNFSAEWLTYANFYQWNKK